MQNKYIIVLLFTAFSQILFFPVSSHALFGIFGSRYQNVKPVNGEVVIPLKNINDGKAHYYSLNEQNSSIRFFIGELKLDLSSDCDRFQPGLIFSQQHRPSCTNITNQTGFKKAVEGNAS